MIASSVRSKTRDATVHSRLAGCSADGSVRGQERKEVGAAIGCSRPPKNGPVAAAPPVRGFCSSNRLRASEGRRGSEVTSASIAAPQRRRGGGTQPRRADGAVRVCSPERATYQMLSDPWTNPSFIRAFTKI